MITLQIKGQHYSIDADLSMPLLWATRVIIGYRGTKYGCGKGLCGSSMVRIDGNTIFKATGKRYNSLPISDFNLD